MTNRMSGHLRVYDFHRGMNIGETPYNLPEGFFRDGLNITQDANGRIVKRGGRLKYNAIATGALIRSMYRFQGASTAYLLACFNNTINLGNDTTGTFTNIGTTASRDSFFAPFLGDCYITDGTNMRVFKSTTLRKWGIDYPTVTPTNGGQNAGAGFSATIGYRYKYTYYNSASGYESADSNYMFTGPFVACASQNIGVTASADSQVTNIRLYRTTDGGSLYYRVNTYANTTATLVDSMSDVTLQLNTAYNFDDNLPPGAARFVCLHQNRMVTAGSTVSPSRVWWSKIGEPESFKATYYYDFLSGAEGEIVQILSYGPYLVVGKENSVWTILGMGNENPVNFYYEERVNNCGFVSSKGVTILNNVIYFLAPDKNIYAMDGNFSPIDISQAISHMWADVDRAALENVQITSYDGTIMVAIPINNATTNTRVFQYIPDTRAWLPYGSMDVRSFSNWVGNSDEGELYSGDYSGYIRKEDEEWTDDGAGYSVGLKSAYYDINNELLLKLLRQVSATIELSSLTDVMTVYVRGIDGQVSTHQITYGSGDIWVGGWIGGWGTRRLSRIVRHNVEQGMFCTHVGVDFIALNTKGQVYISGATISYEIEEDDD